MIEFTVCFALIIWAVLVGTYFGLELVDKGMSIYLKHLEHWQKIRDI